MKPKKYLIELTKLTKRDKEANKFFVWQKNISQEVKIVSYKDIPEIKKNVEMFLQFYRIKVKECFKNSYMVCSYIPKINYVEGMISVLGIPLDHAWNSYKGQYFDLTEEIVLKALEKSSKLEYLKILDMDLGTVTEMASETMVYDTYLKTYYNKKILKNK